MDRDSQLIDPAFLHHQEPQQDVLSIVGLTPDEWNRLELYARVHMNEYFQLISNLSIRPSSILEWGSGYSTYLLCHFGKQWGTQHFLTLDHIQDYQEKILKRLQPHPFLEVKTLDLIGGIWPWDTQPHNYASYPTTLNRTYDLIFVDGRRRNECLLAASRILAAGGILILHDIWRERYRMGMELFRELERFDQYAIMTRRD